MEEKKPLVSVCIPIFNNEDYIKETVLSIIEQSYVNIELIIVDDSSKDKSIEIVKQLIKSYPGKRIKLYENEKNLGMVGNWNKCLSLCTGKYIRLICADDRIDSSLIEKEVTILESDETLVATSTDSIFIDSNGKNKGPYKRYKKSGAVFGEEIVRASFAHRDLYGPPLAILFRKSVYDKTGGFDERFNFILDYDFFTKLFLQGNVFVQHAPLTYFRIRHDSNTGKVLNGEKGQTYLMEHEMLYRKYADRLNLTEKQINRYVLHRKIYSFLGGLYLKVALIGK